MDNINQPIPTSYKQMNISGNTFIGGYPPQGGLGGFPTNLPGQFGGNLQVPINQPNIMFPNPPLLPGQPFMGPMGQIGLRAPPPMTQISANFPELQEKKRQFAKGVYVSGFEKTLTVAMLQDFFSKVKNVHGIKLPMTKLNENKGFAFIYFGSEDDALTVKKQLDRKVILRNQIRVTRTVISDNLSKMMFKLKINAIKSEEIKNIEETLFNDEKLQELVTQIITPVFGATIAVNKIIIPTMKKTTNKLKYARVFFYISEIKNAVNVAKRKPTSQNPNLNLNIQDDKSKNDYDIILTYIAELLNNNEKFNEYIKAELYEYTKKNQANVLHLKGIKSTLGEKSDQVAKQIKDSIQKLNEQWNIANCYAAVYTKMGAWANVTFGSFEEAIQAYETLKQTKPKFRDTILYGSLKNVRDNRTVVISVVKKDVTQQQVTKFLNSLAKQSAVHPIDPLTKRYDYFSFNIIEQKTFFINNDDDTIGLEESQITNVNPSWREMNTVPRRIIVHFINDIKDDNLRDLINDIKQNQHYREIFIEDDRKYSFRCNHQKGHIKDNNYVPHLSKKTEKPKRQQNPRPQRQNRYPHAKTKNQLQAGPSFTKIDYMSLAPKINAPKPGTNSRPQGNQVPQIGQRAQISGNSQLGNTTKGPGGPMIGSPMIGSPMIGQSMIGQPMIGQPMIGQNMIGQPMIGQSMIGQPMIGQQTFSGQQVRPPFIGSGPPNQNIGKIGNQMLPNNQLGMFKTQIPQSQEKQQ